MEVSGGRLCATLSVAEHGHLGKRYRFWRTAEVLCQQVASKRYFEKHTVMLRNEQEKQEGGGGRRGQHATFRHAHAEAQGSDDNDNDGGDVFPVWGE
eukprot:314542-Chlamydomonas_euryale.AAC.2